MKSMHCSLYPLTQQQSTASHPYAYYHQLPTRYSLGYHRRSKHLQSGAQTGTAKSGNPTDRNTPSTVDNPLQHQESAGSGNRLSRNPFRIFARQKRHYSGNVVPSAHSVLYRRQLQLHRHQILGHTL
jgi:hypothetical protein